MTTKADIKTMTQIVKKMVARSGLPTSDRSLAHTMLTVIAKGPDEPDNDHASRRIADLEEDVTVKRAHILRLEGQITDRDAACREMEVNLSSLRNEHTALRSNMMFHDIGTDVQVSVTLPIEKGTQHYDKIRWIKSWREVFNVGLADAKLQIETMAATGQAKHIYCTVPGRKLLLDKGFTVTDRVPPA